MANPRLTPEQLGLANDLLNHIQQRLDDLSQGDRELRFALNRKIAKELGYDERSKPRQRRKLKIQKRREQNGKCAVCGNELPTSGAVLDCFKAIDRYALHNTRLVCQPCDTKCQSERGYS